MNSTLIKTVVLTAVIGAGTAGLVWQHRENVLLESENTQLRARLQSASAQPAQTVAVRRGSPAEVSSLIAQINSLRSSPANSWQERAAQLRELVDGIPELKIPEIRLATDEDWLDATKKPLETDDDYRRALANLRNVVIGRFADEVRKAIAVFQEKNGNQFPTDPAQLEPYLEHSLGAAVWQRYEIQPASATPTIMMGGDWIITQKGPIDAEYDAKFVIGPYGLGTTTYNSLTSQSILAPVMSAYVSANPGKQLTDLNQLLPYATTPEQRAALQKQKDRLGGK